MTEQADAMEKHLVSFLFVGTSSGKWRKSKWEPLKVLEKRNRTQTPFKYNSTMYECTFLNECYLSISQGLLGKREFLPQTECLRKLIVPFCSHRAFARLCRSVFFNLGGCNLKNIDMVCITLPSSSKRLSFCSQNLPSILWCESWISISQHHIAGNSPNDWTAISAGCPITGRGPLPHSSEEHLAPSLQSTAAQSPTKLCSLPSVRAHLGYRLLLHTVTTGLVGELQYAGTIQKKK